MASIQRLTTAEEAQRLLDLRRRSVEAKGPADSPHGDAGYKIRNDRGADHFFCVDNVVLSVITYKGNAADTLCETYARRTRKALAEE